MAAPGVLTQYDPNYGIGVRDTLNKNNVSDDRISYDPASGWVSVDNQRVIRPEANYENRTHTNQAGIDSMLGKVSSLNDIYNRNQQIGSMENSYINPTPYTNPMDTQISDLIKSITSQMNNPTQFDPYTSLQYAASQAQAQKGADQAIRAAQESLGGAGFGRSTLLGERSQGIQNDANQYLQTQVVPQLVAQHQAEEQQKLANLFNLLNPLLSQQGIYDQRHQNDVGNLQNTLNYLTGRQDTSYNRLQDSIANQRADDQFAYTKQQDALAQQNLEAERAYREARDAIADARYKEEFDRDNERFGLQYALDKAVKMNQISVANAQQALANKQLALSREKFDYEKTQATQKSNAKMTEEKQGLATALRNGSISPSSALKQIEEDVQLGFYTKEEAAELKSLIGTLTPNLPTPTMTPTQEQQATIPSDAEIDKIWAGEGQSKGYPKLDYRAWYKDPQGRLGGVDFTTWNKLYGPKLQAK